VTVETDVQGNEMAGQLRGMSRRLENGTLEVRGSIPLGSTRKTKGLAAMRGLRCFRAACEPEQAT
jgi:hypothetical protein